MNRILTPSTPAGLAAGVTEAVAVVTPMEVIKIRLQAQHHSMSDPLDIPKYRNAAHALYTVIKEEGFGAIYRGVSLTALRQGSNQAVNFTAYSYFKDQLYRFQPDMVGANLPSYQTTLIGLVSGAMGPLSNAPIDTIKTRLQKKAAEPGVSAWKRITAIAGEMFKWVPLRPWKQLAGETRMLTRQTPKQARRHARVLQGHHPPHHEGRARPGRHLHRVRVPARAHREDEADLYPWIQVRRIVRETS
ncbi:hypothetical protein IMZ48_15095 [Candidatus Bathyarchaeota archaeon]|nr:hypothetical protein [Candidatus Bathyarchaeota archaeon]